MIKIEEVAKIVSKEQFENYYYSHNNKDCCSYFNISESSLNKLRDYYSLPKKDRTTVQQNHHLQLADEFINTHDINEFTEYFYSHSDADVRNFYSLEFSVLKYIRDKLCLGPKDKITISKLSYKRKTGLDNPSQSKSVQELKRQNIISKYDSFDNYITQWKDKKNSTCIYRYGDVNYNNRDLCKQTCISKYGVDNVAKNKDVASKISDVLSSHSSEFWYNVNSKRNDTILSSYSSLDDYYNSRNEKTRQTLINKYGSVDNAYSKITESRQHTCMSKYGNPYYNNAKQVMQTNLDKYGVPWACMRPEARSFTNDSTPNKDFAKILNDNNIEYEREFSLGSYSYDFRVNDVLIEINPTISHNVTLDIYGNHRITKDYHKNKTQFAKDNGYRCINVWDWDDASKIVKSLSPKSTIYARNCKVMEIDKNTCDEFINLYHFQGVCKNQSIMIGLYYNDMLVQVMTFGKPRYNSRYEYELLRLCSCFNYKIVGGANKLFTYFVRKYSPSSVISYCDNSKFSGDVYVKLGMKLINTSISQHWYNRNTKQHITDNLLRQRGYDQLFGTNFGKGTSNEQLMIDNKFLQVYDAGQSTYIINF